MSAIEWAPYIVKQGVSDSTVVEKADAVQADFIQQQAGFIRRELVRKSAREYADVLYWSSKDEAEAASEKIMDHDVCKAYFEIMDEGANVSAGFAHYDIVKSWAGSN